MKQQQECNYFSDQPSSFGSSSESQQAETPAAALVETAGAGTARPYNSSPLLEQQERTVVDEQVEEEQAETDSMPSSSLTSPSDQSRSDSEDCEVAGKNTSHDRAVVVEDENGRAAAAATAVAATGHRQELHQPLQPEGMQLLPPPAYVPEPSAAAEKAKALLFTAHTNNATSGPPSLLRRRRTSPAALAAAVHRESKNSSSSGSGVGEIAVAASHYSPFTYTSGPPLHLSGSGSAARSKKISVRSSSSSSQPAFYSGKLCEEYYASTPTSAAATGERGSSRADAVATARGGGAPELSSSSSVGAVVGDSRLDDICVRPFRPEDADAVRQLCYRHFRSQALPSVFFWLCHHCVDLITLFLISICFLPLKGVLLSALVFFGYLLLRGVWEFELYIRRDCPDLHDIQRSYMQNKGSGFWVAERIEKVKLPWNSAKNSSKLESANTRAERGGGGAGGNTTRRIVACIGLAPLQTDKKTAQLVRLVVDRSLRRQHIGTLLLNTFITYALQQHYTTVRLYTNNLNNDSLRFAKTKGFELQQVVRRGLMRGDLLKWQKKLEAPKTSQRRSRVSNIPSSVLD